MALKLENINNLISDDLDKRNDNWTEIDTTFGLKADKTTTYTKTEVDASLGLKANKLQENWIEPTLLNGWEQYSETQKVQYMKDEFGFVHLRGMVKNGTLGIIYVLPDGYKPRDSMYFIINNTAVARQLTVSGTGSVTVVSSFTTTWVSLDGIIFRAGA